MTTTSANNSDKLKNYIAELRKNKAEVQDKQTMLYWGCPADTPYLAHLKGCVGSCTVYVKQETITMLGQVTMYCESKQCTKVISSSVALLTKLLKWDKRAAPSLSNYAGSYFKIPGFKETSPDIEIVFIPPLKQLVTVPYGKFITTRLVTKLTKPESWFPVTKFNNFTLLTPANEDQFFTQFASAQLVSIDIETLRENCVIRCLSYTAFHFAYSGAEAKWTSQSVVLPLASGYALAIMRKWNWQLKAPKVFQNGRYDIAYLTRYNAPVYNYLYDTANLFHSWYSELPKDLGFLNAFFIREAMYWKDLAETNDLYEYYKYNALDTWGTGNCFLAMLNEAPKYALQNYLAEFPLTFPCHLSEMTGIARDIEKLDEARKAQQVIVDEASAKLNTMLDIPEGECFNVKSPIQMKALLKLLGCKDLPSADEKNLTKARFRHPLNARILGLVITIRKARTLLSTYLVAGKEFSRQDGTGSRVLYGLNPAGTDTSRLASREHHFWCGLQVQNIPRGGIVKSTMKADPGFLMAEVDLEQAESRDTAYISGDENLIHNVEYSPDFHSANASSFFGVPFEEIYDAVTDKVLNKPLRQLAKPVNHGANYNMGAYVLIDTMGEEKVLLAKTLLKLPRFWPLIQVAEHLLAQFHLTYSKIKPVYYEGVKKEIALTSMLKSNAVHYCTAIEAYPKLLEEKGAWTRYCFGKPDKSKQALNAYVAHPPQSLNAQTLNRAYLDVFHNIAMHDTHKHNFKLLAQIHDSILFQYREGHEYLCDEVVNYMQIPVTVKAYDGKIRTFTVPAGAKRGLHLPAPNTGRAVYWSETE